MKTDPDHFQLATADRAPESSPIATAIASNAFRVAVVGFGPKGFYALERLLAELCNGGAPTMPVEVHLFDRGPYPAAGEVYRPDQPRYLLMNFSNAHIDAGPHSAPRSIAGHLPDLIEWLAQNGFDANPHGYAPRAVVGRYLTDLWERLRDACPETIQLHLHQAEVFDLARLGDQNAPFKLWYRTRGGEPQAQTVDRVILTTGHQFPERSGKASTVDFIYPVSNLGESRIAAGSRVAVRGLGLTFIDAALALTEGRGGIFQVNGKGDFDYRHSGREPACLLPFSRSGLPMVPRGRTHGVDRTEPAFFTAQHLVELRSQRGREGMDFEADLLPLLLDEMTLAYYRVAYRTGAGEEQQNDFPPPPADRNLLIGWVDAFHRRHPHLARFHPRQLFAPFTDEADQNADPHERLFGYWTQLDHAASLGEADHPLIAAATTWRHLSAAFAGGYRDGGLSAASHRSFLQNYAGHLNRLAFGPPLVNSRKILSLCRAGLIDFAFSQNPQVAAKSDSKFKLSCRTARHSVDCDTFIDARIPRHRASTDPAPLYRRMIEHGLARPYVNRNTGRTNSGEAFAPGCVETTAAGQLVTREGGIEPCITLYGTPTEGLTWDNDTLSRRHNDFATCWAASTARAATRLPAATG